MYKRQDEAGSKEIQYYIYVFSVSTQKRLKQLVLGNKVLIQMRVGRSVKTQLSK